MSCTVCTLLARLASSRAFLCVAALFGALAFAQQAHATPVDVTFTIQRVRSCCDTVDDADPFFRLFAPAIGVSLRTPTHHGLDEGQFENFNEEFKFRADTSVGTLNIEVEQWDDDQAFNGSDDRIDMTGPGGDTVQIAIDLVNKSWRTTNGNFCNGPLDAFGGCTAGRTQGPDDFLGSDDDGGMEWTITFSICGVPFIDTDRDGLFDQWETSGIDTDCNGSIDVPIHTFGANPLHKDIFFEYDWCSTTPPQRSAVQNTKAAFRAAPINATGFPNPDGQPGINLWIDTGGLIDATADEGRPSCADGIDNDGNGQTDALDPTCIGRLREGPIPSPGTCGDGLDNDADMLADGADPDCLVGDNLGGGNAIVCPARGIPNLNGPDNCDRSVNPANTCVPSGVNTGACSVGGAACVPENGFFSVLRGPNFAANRAVAFRYAVQAPGATGQAIEDGVGTCSDGLENSPIPSDGIDGADPVCAAGVEDGIPGACFNGRDDRADGTIDRLDTDCNRNEDGAPAGSCYDAIDNSADGADQADAQCAAMREDGGGAGSCFDGIDNSNPFNIPFLGDGADAADTQCQVVEDGVAGATCYNARDDQADGFRDALDPDCAPMVEDGAPAGSCYDTIDNSGDGADRNDPDCAGLAENGKPPGSCYDGIENIWDGLDGADPDCNFGGGWGGGDNLIVYNTDPGGGTLMHEIGHTLGLGHGGGDGNNCKPNYVSVMNYDLQFGINQQPGRAVEGTLLTLAFASEDGAAAGSCADGIDNGGMDGIDLLDPDCQSCLDTVDNDGDSLIDGNDTDCLGLDNNADGTPDQLAIDYSPPRFPGGRAQVLPNLIETAVTEAGSLVAIDVDGDGIQDLSTDPINMIAYHPFNGVAGFETPGGAVAQCSDGVDNDGDGFADQLDTTCVGATAFAPIYGNDYTGDGVPDGIDWNMDGNATGLVAVNADGGPQTDCQNGRFLAGLSEDGVVGGCGDGMDNGGGTPGDGADGADPECRISGFDDWTNIKPRTAANGGPGSPVPTLREPTFEELRQRNFEARAADLVIDSNQTVIPVAADGSITLEVAVENVSPTPAWGPVRLVIQGVPEDVIVQSELGVCVREGANVVCTRGWLLAYEVWDLQLKLGAGQCDWIATGLHLAVQALGGRELTPIDNELDLAVDAGGAWPMWKLCGSRWGEAPYNGPVGSGIGWSRAMISPMRSSAMVAADGSLYVVTVTGMLYSLNSNGTVRWNRLVGVNINGSPALTPSGLVVVASTVGSVLAFRQSDGVPMWSWFGTSLINGSPAVASDGTIYVSSGFGLNGDSLIALTSAGALKWRLALGGSSVSSTALGSDGTIYVSTAGSLLQQARLIAVSPAGVQLWSTPIGNTSKSSPTVRDGRVYIGNDQGQVLALNATTGAIVWTYTMTCPFLQICRIDGSPSVSGLGEVIVGASNGTVFKLQDSGASPTLRWSVTTQAPIAGSPILSNNRIVYIGAGTRVYALRADTGAQVFRSQTFGIIAGTPSLTPTGTLLIGSDDNFVRAFTGP